jgi:hypothetical protein
MKREHNNEDAVEEIKMMKENNINTDSRSYGDCRLPL